MKKPFLMAIILCTCATFFCHRDTGRQKEGRRTFEARLSNVSEWEPCPKKPPAIGRVVEETQCGPEAVIVEQACEETIDTHSDARTVLSSKPQCIDAAIDVLTRFATSEPAAASDLAAAYYTRAQRNDEPGDFLNALENANAAVRRAPQLSAAWFNQALIQEALGLTAEAIASWDRFLAMERTPWAKEASAHRNGLIRNQSGDDAIRWRRNRDALAIALRAGDRNALAALIDEFPSAAQRYLEEELLPQCASSGSREELGRTTLFAAALSRRLQGDPFPIDIVAAIARARQLPQTSAALRKGHSVFRQARLTENSFDYQKAAAEYADAKTALLLGGSPLHLRAGLGHLAITRDPDLSELDAIEREAAARHYRHLLARVHWVRGARTQQNRYMESLTEYEAARREYARLRDYEGLAAIHTRLAGVLLKIGHPKQAWREAFYTTRHAARLITVRDRQACLTEAVSAALALQHPRTALLYQEVATKMLRTEGTAVNVAIALQKRAEIETRLGRDTEAAIDLAETDRITIRDSDVRRDLNAHSAEIRAQGLLHIDEAAAIDALQRAIENTPTDRKTIRISLLTQLAEAEIRARQITAAERHLRQALAELRAEQVLILATRKHESDNLWLKYFSRFQETHKALIRLLMLGKRPIEAFAYAERARGIELLDRMLALEAAPPRFSITADVIDAATAQTGLAEIQAALPRGVFIIEYSVLDDRVCAWVISRDAFEAMTLPAVNAQRIADWNARLQRAVRSPNAVDAGIVFRAAYATLAAEPLRLIASMPGGNPPERLVFIPDGGIHGLPIAAFQSGTRPARYVIDIAPVEIGGSSLLYLLSRRRNESVAATATPSVLAVGNPAFDRTLPFTTGMKNLSHAEDEAKQVSAIYSRGSKPLIGRDATVSAFLERASRSEIVHVAAHALVNAEVPSRSMLLLAQSPVDRGVIDAEGLLNRLKLTRTRLVVLAACSSAGGPTVGPEGVGPLVRSLLAAGAPAVVGTLWNIDDATTETLMVSFHRHYEASGDAAVAMRNAQRQLLRENNNQLGNQSVFAWAPFQVIGHTSPPTTRPPSHGGTSLGIHSSNSLQRPDRLRPQ